MNDLLLRRRALMMAQKKSRLPSAFQEVEYLESTGTQYIISDYTFTNGDVIDLCFAMTDLTGSHNGNIFGAYGGTYNVIGNLPNIGIYCQWNTAGGGHVSSGIRDLLWHRCVADLSAYKITIDNIDYIKSSPLPCVPANRTFSVFTSIDAYYYDYRIKAKLGYIYVYRNLNKILDFVPCYRKSDNKPGLYDLCGSICPLTNSPFYINSGSGEFIVGPDVK